MLSNGAITPDEFDTIHEVLMMKLSHYDAALTQHMIAYVNDKQSKLYKGQCLYWQHCMAAIKDTISFARTLIRINNERATVQSPWANYSERGGDNDGGESEPFGSEG